MILPTKGIGNDKALLSIGAEVLRELDEPMTVSRLWDAIRKRNDDKLDITFDWFVLALDLLFVLGAIMYDRGRLHRSCAGA